MAFSDGASLDDFFGDRVEMEGRDSDWEAIVRQLGGDWNVAMLKAPTLQIIEHGSPAGGKLWQQRSPVLKKALSRCSARRTLSFYHLPFVARVIRKPIEGMCRHIAALDDLAGPLQDELYAHFSYLLDEPPRHPGHHCAGNTTMEQLTKEGCKQRRAAGGVGRANYPFNASIDRVHPSRPDGRRSLDKLVVCCKGCNFVKSGVSVGSLVDRRRNNDEQGWEGVKLRAKGAYTASLLLLSSYKEQKGAHSLPSKW